jgi:polyphosphate glucokinase
MVLDESGNSVSERARIPTPQPAKPDAVLAAIIELAEKQGDRVLVGFLGVVCRGVTEIAANLALDWV